MVALEAPACPAAARAASSDATPLLELSKPQLVRLFEAIAAVMELDRGLHRLELLFDDGHLRPWTTHHERNGHAELRRFDDVVELLVSRLRLVV